MRGMPLEPLERLLQELSVREPSLLERVPQGRSLALPEGPPFSFVSLVSLVFFVVHLRNPQFYLGLPDTPASARL